METAPLGLNVIDIAKWLKKRKENGHSTVLFLGSRAGGLFRSKTFYSTSKRFSPRAFQDMTQSQQFRECYRVLCEGDFVQGDINSILMASLQSLKIVQADSHLADLVRLGFFDLIISTNVDNLLPRAFIETGMKIDEDFQVFIPQRHPLDEFMYQQHKHLCTLMKISGDLEIGEYNLFKQNFYLETYEMLKNFLSSALSDTFLMLGYDPFWDRAIDIVLPSKGQEFWYVNEEGPSSSLSAIVKSRKGKCIVGDEGGYESFIQKLYWRLDEEGSLDESLVFDSWKSEVNSFHQTSNMLNVAANTTQARNDQNQTAKEQRSKKGQPTDVFVGYSRKDRWYLEKLKSHMARYERENLLNVWDDQKVKAGKNYIDELRYAISITKVAILLVSPDFLASDFIASNVLPPLLQAAEKEGAVILPVIIKPCVFEDTALHYYQPFDDPSKPLSARKAPGKDEVWANLVRYVIALGRDIEHGH